VAGAAGGNHIAEFRRIGAFHTYPAGRPSGNHWGPAIADETAAQSPYYFNFHVGDLGHTLIIGPSGAGKTVVQNCQHRDKNGPGTGLKRGQLG
jgi:type IV secretory pathway VirB4 component